MASQPIAYQLLGIDRPQSKPLTQREWEVGMLATSGHCDKEIAAQLGMTVRTVQGHLLGCYKKFGLVNSWGNPRVRLTLALQAR